MFISRFQVWQPFLLSLLAVSTFSSKALHVFQHVHSIPRVNLVLYLPTFFIQDTLLCIAVWFLLHKTSGVKSVAAVTISGILAFITLAAASSQIGFYFVTCSEIRWNTAKSVGNDPEGRKLMLSGLKPVVAASIFLFITAWFLTPGLYVLIARWLPAHYYGKKEPEPSSMQLPRANAKRKAHVITPARIWTVCLTIGVVGLWIIRPSVPYSHMSGTLPVVLLQAFAPRPMSSQLDAQSFPFPDLVKQEYWEPPHGHFPGWAPNATARNSASPYTQPRPWWASGELPPGFKRWEQASSFDSDDSNRGEDNETTSFYNPVTDPLRITNLDLGVLEPLKQALQDHDIPITHVVLVLMESSRKDTFPFIAGSPLHEKILASHDTTDPAVVQQVNEKLSRMTPTAEQLTGKSSGFTGYSDNLLKSGGLNVEGVFTGSSLSFKSAIMNYCGVQPLPVNFMEEVGSEIYQPCIMQILELFNRLKGDSTSDAIHDQKWKSIFVQSITGRYDKQNVLNDHMGFNESIYKETLIDKNSKYYHVPMERINYFGYPEYEVYPYIRDAINDAVKKKTRLFLSHFTSTTHHPWGTPREFEYVDYFPTYGVMAKSHEDMNSYLNAVRYVDTWLGEIMKLLDETGIANETLVVLVGDHGQAFSEDSPASGTYQNGHVSNFHIPLIFHHPLLPRMQVTANTTSLSLLPTLLDLLVQTRSLNDKDSDIASDLMNEYEGQSLIRPYKATHKGRQAWNFGLINPGGEILSVGSAAVPYRLILPMTDDFEYKFINQETDSEEQNIIAEWEVEMLAEHVRSVHGDLAAKWVGDAVQVGRWWVGERKRLWNYHE